MDSNIIYLGNKIKKNRWVNPEGLSSLFKKSTTVSSDEFDFSKLSVNTTNKNACQISRG